MAKTTKKTGRPQSAKQLESQIESLLTAPVNELGFELADVEYAIEDGNNVLTLYIDREGGVSIDDCETVHRAVDPLIDEIDPIEEAYYLSVSSLGLDRPLRKPKDYARNRGNVITVGLYAPIDGKKQVRGTLLDSDDTGCVLEVEGKTIELTYKKIASAKPYIEF